MQDYYLLREAVADYSDYWGHATDPDGCVRTRNSEEERLRFVDDTQYLIDRVNALQPESVLDFGAGLGWLLDEIDAPCCEAVEISPQAVEHLTKLRYTVYSDLADVKSSMFDVVIAHHVIEHLVDPLYAMNHMRRILKPYGTLVLATPDFASPCAKRFGENYRMLHDKTHCSLFTLESGTRMLRDLGFKIQDVVFPFPDRYATADTFMRWNDTSKTSPPWPGNWVTWFAKR